MLAVLTHELTKAFGLMPNSYFQSGSSPRIFVHVELIEHGEQSRELVGDDFTRLLWEMVRKRSGSPGELIWRGRGHTNETAGSFFYVQNNNAFWVWKSYWYSSSFTFVRPGGASDDCAAPGPSDEETPGPIQHIKLNFFNHVRRSAVKCSHREKVPTLRSRPQMLGAHRGTWQRYANASTKARDLLQPLLQVMLKHVGRMPPFSLDVASL